MALSKKVDLDKLSDEATVVEPTYGTRYLDRPVPRYELPDASMPARVAYRMVHDEMNLDGNPTLNLATFVSTWMEPEADTLMMETMNKNSIDQDEYPQTVEIQNRCVNILARLFSAPDAETAIGTATIGSSEAIDLAGLVMKWNWRRRQKAANKPTDKPNLVMGHNVQVCWEKFVRYFDVEPRFVDLTHDRYVIGVDEALALVDDNTIGVVGILGSTYTGEFEPIKELAAALDDLQKKQGLDVPIHVDAASGGFVAPFTQPDLEWDFRLPRVKSINTSGHKYGLVYPGVGWAVWRDKAVVPEDLIFHTNYLGSDEPTFDLNFSRGAGPIVAQYYNFMRLGRHGYAQVMSRLIDTARRLAEGIDATDHFDLISKKDALPLVCFRLVGDHAYDIFDVSRVLRERGWIVPAYTLAPKADDISVLRVVVRESLSRDLVDLLLDDLGRAIERLERTGGLADTPKPKGKRQGVC